MPKPKAIQAESIWAALGGVLTGYVLWLIAISIGDFFSTAGLWGPIVLGLSVILALGATIWARRVQAQDNTNLAAFAYGLPALPVLLSVLVLADSYL